MIQVLQGFSHGMRAGEVSRLAAERFAASGRLAAELAKSPSIRAYRHTDIFAIPPPMVSNALEMP